MSYFKFSNPHPTGKLTNDCVIRAIVHATDKNYFEASADVKRFKKVTKESSYTSRKHVKRYIEEALNAKKISFPAEKGCPRMNGRRFAETYKTGTYILNMAGHVVTCKDGVILDTWNCLDRCVYNAWKVR